MDLLVLLWLVVLDLLEAFAHPVTHLSIFNMHELNANFAAIRISIRFDQISELPFGLLFQDGAFVWVRIVDFFVHVLLSEAVSGRVQEGHQALIRESELLCKAGAIFVNFSELEWVDIGHKVTVGHKRSQKHGQADRFISNSYRICARNSSSEGASLQLLHKLRELSIDCGSPKSGGRLERHGGTALLSSEVGVPRRVDAGWVLLPLGIHVVDVIRVCAIHEAGFFGSERPDSASLGWEAHLGQRGHSGPGGE